MRRRAAVLGAAIVTLVGCATVAVAAAPGKTISCTQTSTTLTCPLTAATTTRTVTSTVRTTVTAPGTTVTVTSTPATTTAPTTTSTPATSTSTTTTTTPTTTTTTTPAGQINCAPNPSACGYPDATNTGAKGSLRKVPSEVSSGPGWHYDSRGWMQVDGSNVTIENLDVGVNLDINGSSNVTLKNVRVTEHGESFGISLRHTTNVTLEDVTIAPPANQERLLVGIKDIYGDSTGTTIRRADISGISTGVQMDEGTLVDSYVHGLRYKADDHLNGVMSNGGVAPLTIRHNTVFNSFAQTDAVGLFQDFGPQKNRVVDNNLLAGGGYSIYGGANTGKEATATNIKITNNRISRIYFPKGGDFGWLAAWNPAGAGNVLSGNVWDDSNSPVN